MLNDKTLEEKYHLDNIELWMLKHYFNFEVTESSICQEQNDRKVMIHKYDATIKLVDTYFSFKYDKKLDIYYLCDANEVADWCRENIGRNHPKFIENKTDAEKAEMIKEFANEQNFDFTPYLSNDEDPLDFNLETTLIGSDIESILIVAMNFKAFQEVVINAGK